MHPESLRETSDELAGAGLRAKLAGDYHHSRRLLKQAYDLEVDVRGYQRPCFLVDVLLNWADAQRRLSRQPEDIHIRYALGLFAMAFRLLLNAPECDRQAIACLHHYARLERQRGNYQEANRLIGLAVRAVRSYVWRRPLEWYSPVIDRVMIPLDAASFRALNSRPMAARLAAAEALTWCLHPAFWLRGEVDRTHVGRAVILLKHAGNPLADNPLVRRACFGRGVSME